MHDKSTPIAATNDLAIAIAFIDWFTAPAPIACNSTFLFSCNPPAIAPATLFGFDLLDTFKTILFSILIFLSFLIF
mgnify:CR=1 FL=1